MVIVTLLTSTLPALRQQNWLALSSKCTQDPSSLTTSSAVTLSHAVLFLQDHPPTSSLHPHHLRDCRGQSLSSTLCQILSLPYSKPGGLSFCRGEAVVPTMTIT